MNAMTTTTSAAVLPPSHQQPIPRARSLLKTRVALFGSFLGGYHVLQELLFGELARRITVTGVASDDPTQPFTHPHVRELVNLQNVNGKAKPYQIRQLLQLVERYDLRLRDES